MNNQESKYRELLDSLKEFYEECGEELQACYEEAHDLLVKILTQHGIFA
ncbi:MAG: hypothetical protein ACFFE8_00135 [Candidatus Heimdallarchaeota archaeon]